MSDFKIPNLKSESALMAVPANDWKKLKPEQLTAYSNDELNTISKAIKERISVNADRKSLNEMISSAKKKKPAAAPAAASAVAVAPAAVPLGAPPAPAASKNVRVVPLGPAINANKNRKAPNGSMIFAASTSGGSRRRRSKRTCRTKRSKRSKRTRRHR